MSSITEDINRFCLHLSNGSNISLIDNPVHHISVGVFPNEVFLSSLFSDWLTYRDFNLTMKYLIEQDHSNEWKENFLLLNIVHDKIAISLFKMQVKLIIYCKFTILFNNFKWITMQIYSGYFKRRFWWCLHERSMERVDSIARE